MKNPEELEVLAKGTSYEIPKYKVTDKGVEDAGVEVINFCKGNKEDAEILRKEGVFTESLIAVLVTHLQELNVGDLANRDTSIAITHLEDALLRLQKRQADRKKRGVAQTYKK